MKPTTPHHPSEFLLDYLEDALAPEERSGVEQHLRECAECAEELEEIRLLAEGLRTHKDRVFCPDAADLFRFTRSGEDPDGKISEHVEQCEACREDVSLYRKSDGEELASPTVREAFGKLAAARAESPPPRKGLFKSILEHLSAPFGMPVAALGAAAAAVLLVILIYPRSGVEPMIGLSSVEWERTPAKSKPKSLIEPPRVAVVLAFSGLRSPLGQGTVDSLYRELRPTQLMRKRYEFSNPSRVRSLLSSKKIDTQDWHKGRAQLMRALHVDLILILRVELEKDRWGLKGELVDGKSGRVLGTEALPGVDEKDLSSQLKKAMIDLLNRHIQGGSA
jgi:anti-sigma factor RsiW